MQCYLAALLFQQVQQQNVLAPGGIADIGGQITTLTVTGEVLSVEQLRQLLHENGINVRVGGLETAAPGEVVLFQGRSYKASRGMGSLGAMTQGSADRYFQDPANNADKLVPEGIEGRVPYKGSVLSIIFQLVGGVRSSMGYVGCRSIAEMHEKAEFVEISSAGIRESHVHDVQITKEAPNYHVD